MTHLTKKCHIQTLADAIELSLIASLIALFADTIWVIHDVHQNGMSCIYIVIFIGLSSGLIITGVALFRHHTGKMHNTLKTLLHVKLAKQKSINKHKREHRL